MAQFLLRKPVNDLSQYYHPSSIHATLGQPNRLKIFFRNRSSQIPQNWAGDGRAVARLVTPPGSDVYHIKVDEDADICITTHILGGLAVTHLFSGVLLWSLPPDYVRPKAHCEYDNGYLVFDRIDGRKEVWRLASDIIVGGEEAAHESPPDEEQRLVSMTAASTHHRYTLHGHFRPWAMISSPEVTSAYRVVHTTLLCANNQHAFLYDLRTGALVQTIKVNRIPQEVGLCHVDMDERHVVVCESYAVHVFARDRGTEVFRIGSDVFTPKMMAGTVGLRAYGGAFVESGSLSWRLGDDSRSDFLEAHISGDGRDLAILTTSNRVLLYEDFECIRCGPVSAGQVLRLSSRDRCLALAFKHRRLCIATLHALYIINLGHSTDTDSAKVVIVRPYLDSAPTSNHGFSCMQLTDRRIYFTWEDARRRDVPLLKDKRNTRSGPIRKPFGSFNVLASLSEPRNTILGSLKIRLGSLRTLRRIKTVGGFLMCQCHFGAMSTAELSQGAWLNPEFDPREGVSVGCIDFGLMPESSAIASRNRECFF